MLQAIQQGWHHYGTEVIGYTAAAAGLYSTWARTMIPLRMAAIVTNVLFISYGALKGIYPTILVNCVLLPLNFVRLRDMTQLLTNVRRASESDLNIEWLRPFLKRRAFRAGDRIWNLGDPATEAVYIYSGRVELVEMRREVGEGTLIGEMGLFDPDSRRLLSARCETAVECGVITYDEFRQLFYQNPEFGFYMMRLVTARMQENMRMLASATSSTSPRSMPLRPPREL